MMHPNRCGNGCNLFVAPEGKYFTAGSCKSFGIKKTLTPQVRTWIDIHGCCTYGCSGVQ